MISSSAGVQKRARQRDQISQESGQVVRISKKSRKSLIGTSKTSNYSRSKYIVNRTRLLEEIRLCAPRLAYWFKGNVLPTISCNPDILREMMIMMVQVLSPKEDGADTKSALEIECDEKVESLMDGATADRNNLAQKCRLFHQVYRKWIWCCLHTKPDKKLMDLKAWHASDGVVILKPSRISDFRG